MTSHDRITNLNLYGGWRMRAAANNPPAEGRGRPGAPDPKCGSCPPAGFLTPSGAPAPDLDHPILKAARAC